MFCHNCGTEVPDGAIFCSSCGTRLAEKNDMSAKEDNSPQAVPAVLNEVQPQAPRAALNNARPDRMTVIDAAKSVFSSGVAFFAVIAYTVFVFLSFLSIFSGSSIAEELKDWFLYELDVTSFEMRTFMSIFTGFRLIQIIPLVLMAIGMWMIYVHASSKNSSPMNIAGLSLIKVLMILRLAAICMAAFAVFVYIIIIMFAITAFAADTSLYTYINPGMEIRAIGGMVVFLCLLAITIAIAVLVMNIIFYIKSIKTLDIMTYAARDGYISGEASSFVGVMLVIMAAVSGIGAFMQLLSAMVSSGGFFTLCSFLGSLCYAVACIALATVVFSYRSKMRQAAQKN